MGHRCACTFFLYLFYRCIILYGKLDVTLILLRLRFEVVIYCSFVPIVFVGFGIVANSKTMIINGQYFSQMGRSQGKKLISLLINVYVFKEGIQLKK